MRRMQARRPIDMLVFARRRFVVHAALLLVTASATAQDGTSDSDSRRFLIDLTPAMHTALLGDSYLDESLVVTVEAGQRFLFLPFSLQPFASVDAEVSLNTATIKAECSTGKKPRVLGFQLWQRVRDRVQPARDRAAPLFEKVTIKPTRDEGVLIEAYSTRRPRRPPASRPAATSRPAAGRPAAPRAATARSISGRRKLGSDDWLAVVVAVDDADREIRIGLHREAMERIGISFVDDASRRFTFTPRTGTDDPTITAALRWADSDAPAMAALALARIAEWRQGTTDKIKRELLDAFTASLARGAAAADDRPREIAWRSLVTRSAFNAAEREVLQGLAGRVGISWVSHATRELPRADGAWRANLLTLLHLAWRVADAACCDGIIDAVLADGRPEAFDVFDGANAAGLDAIFRRARGVTDVRLRAGLLRSLIGQTPVEREAELLAEAQRLELQIVDPADPIFRRFADANDPRVRQSILNALKVVPCSAVHHTQQFARFIDAATGPRQDVAVRESAFAMVLAQAAFGMAPVDIQPHGAFPLSSERGVDGLTAGLARAVVEGAPDTRMAALRALLLRGEARAAAGAVGDLRLSPDAIAALLAKLTGLDGAARADGTFAFMAELASSGDRRAAPVVLRQLEQASGGYPASLRWRLITALKCGIDWKRWTALASDRDAAIAGLATRWIVSAAHLSGAHQSAWNAARRANEKLELLKRINRDSSVTPASRYGCLLIVEAIEPLDPLRHGRAGGVRWNAPRRITLFGPIVIARDVGGKIVFAAAERQLGEGRPARLDAMVPDEKSWPPTMRAATWTLAGVGVDANGKPAAFAPLTIPGAALMPEGGEGAVNIDVVPLLRPVLAAASPDPIRALTWNPTTVDCVLSDLLPETFRLTLRPAGFGSWVGSGPSQPPETSSADKPALLNVMVILEPIE